MELRRHVLAVMLASFAGGSGVAQTQDIPVLDIVPRAVQAGGLLVVTVPASAVVGGDGCEKELTVSIGSKVLPITKCAVEDGKGYLTATVPKAAQDTPAEGRQDTPAEGRQRLSVHLSGGEDPSNPATPPLLPPGAFKPFPGDDYRNIDVLPRGSGVVLAVLDPKRVNTALLQGRIFDFVRSNLNKLPPPVRGVFDEVVGPFNRLEFQEMLPRDPLPGPNVLTTPLPGERPSLPYDRQPFDGQSWVKVDVKRAFSLPAFPSVSVCNPGVKLLSFEQESDIPANIGLLYDIIARTQSADSVVIGPATLGIPSQSQDPSQLDRTAKHRARTAANVESIGTLDPTLKRVHLGVSGKGAVIYLIDTLEPLENSTAQTGTSPADVFAARPYPVPSDGQIYLMDAHGAAVRKIMTWGVANDVTVRERAACDPHGRCLLESVVRGVCEAAAAARSGQRVIVNLSMAGPTDNPILRSALATAVRAGAAVVTGFGNADACNGRNFDLRDYCNAYPADWTADKSFNSLYAVGAWDVVGGGIHGFQRGQPLVDPAEQPKSTFTIPNVMAPAFFWFTELKSGPPHMGGLKTTDGKDVNLSATRPYAGTSFSAPVVSGVLALLAEKCGSTPDWQWPASTDLMTDMQGMSMSTIRVPNLRAWTCP